MLFLYPHYPFFLQTLAAFLIFDVFGGGSVIFYSFCLDTPQTFNLHLFVYYALSARLELFYFFHLEAISGF